ncbi:type IV secretory system conjugative DNA transfer family protein [Nocardia tengchongensis]|uniref:type IV secretory system conjugative DNA transfer family protein n=1 Tax=Nocardia tengchongensis TaxID=2055889 RepID=UPI003687F4E5
MDRSVKAPGSSSDLSEYKELIAAGMAVGLGEATSASLRLGELLYGAPDQDGITWQPLDLAIRMMTGQVHWTGAATGGAVTLAAGTAVGVVGAVWAWQRACLKCAELKASSARKSAEKHARKMAARKPGRVAVKASNTVSLTPIRPERVDSQARFMARDGELDDLGFDAMAAKADKLGVQLRDGDAPGVLIARAVVDGRPLFASFEDLAVDIWGPRSGKTTSRVIPAVLEAVGPVVATSNKPDVVDATRTARKEVGDVFVFDPQQVAEEPCTWYWDPIAWVAGPEGGKGAQKRAAELAGHFADDNNDGPQGGDNFFPQEGEDLLAGLILACALAKRPITQVFAWVTKVDNREPIKILQAAGYDLVAAALSEQYTAQVKQRDGVFGTAKKMAGCLKYDEIRPWVTPPAAGEAPRRSFDVEKFVRSRDTLFPLSEEGQGSAAPLVVALCAAVADAGKREARRHRGRRLPVPLLIVLDEAANIVRWRDLPKQYSHFGSRGIVVMTILQSWAQGVRCWGPDGMKALLSAANVLTLGAGLKDTSFLKDMSELVGHHYELLTSTSESRGKDRNSRSTSTSTSRVTEVTLAPSDLQALPAGRVLVFINGHRAVLGATVPWFERSYADDIAAELDRINDSHTTAAAAPAPLRVVPPWTEDDDEEGETA